jgi:hypothetical protein
LIHHPSSSSVTITTINVNVNVKINVILSFLFFFFHTGSCRYLNALVQEPAVLVLPHFHKLFTMDHPAVTAMRSAAGQLLGEVPTTPTPPPPMTWRSR